MGERRAVQHVSQLPPVWQASVQHSAKSIIVVTHEQVGHFMHDDVFETFQWLFREFCIEANAAAA
jgi:hypothetical protein